MLNRINIVKDKLCDNLNVILGFFWEPFYWALYFIANKIIKIKTYLATLFGLLCIIFLIMIVAPPHDDVLQSVCLSSGFAVVSFFLCICERPNRPRHRHRRNQIRVELDPPHFEIA